MEQPQLGLKISELRKQKGLTQEELVEQCNINVRTLQRIESGEVSPRSYTIKTILSALDYDYELLSQEKKQSNFEFTTIPAKERKSIHSLLATSWIAGILFLITAVFESVGDAVRIGYIPIEDNLLIYGVWGHIIIKVLVIVFNGLLLYGFLISGNLLRNHLMKISSILMFVVLLCFYTFDIVSIFNPVLDIKTIFFAEAIVFGIVGILFGVSILKSRQILGNIGLVSGIIELIMAACLLTIILSPLALFLFIPAVILEILVLYKVASMVKEQM